MMIARCEVPCPCLEASKPLPQSPSFISVQIWNNSSQWKGWLMWVDRSTPDSYRALLQLPLTVLQKVLAEKGAGGETLRAALAAHVVSPQNSVAVLPQMLRYLQQPSGQNAGAIVPA